MVVNELAVSTGKFTDPLDADNKNSFSLFQPAPAFPGEDFLQNDPGDLIFPLDLVGSKVMISLEPFPDDDPQLFGIILLTGQIPLDAVEHVTYFLDNDVSRLPTGVATIK